jgi:alanyl-tRNA synthetase
VNNDHPQVIEIWNNVFMEFNRKADGSLEKLPAQHVDTGMGFERLVRAIEAKSSNYDTDVFVPSIQFIERHSGIKYEFGDSKSDIAMRVMADHIRAICFAIADGQLPSNNGAGYVIRRILRRAVRYQYQFLNLKEPFLCRLAEIIADSFANVFPELFAQKEFVVKVIREEEQSFLRTIATGMTILNGKFGAGDKMISGKDAFELSDTYGFPLDLTELISRENGFEVDSVGYKKALEEQKDRSRKATELTTDDWFPVYEATAGTQYFTGYDTLEADQAAILKLRKVKKGKTELVQIVIDQCPFYPEGGGQVGDTGKLYFKNGEVLEIIDTVKENGIIQLIAEKVPTDPFNYFVAQVDAEKRRLTEANHSATHLLHAALRNVLGTHVQQKGSLVNSEYLRFDISHFAAMTDEELARVEHMVNQKVRENIALDERRSVPIEEAKQLGAMMLFGEKYGDAVRVITFDEKFSRELCGGTHVKATGQIGYFKILSESASSAGIRRIEAITADAAGQYVDNLQSTVDGLKDLLKAKDLVRSVEQLMAEKAELQKKLEQFENEKTVQIKQQLKSQVSNLNGVNALIAQVDISSADQLKNLSFQLKGEIENLFCVLGCMLNGKPMLSVIISDNLVADKKMHAGNIVKDLAKEIQGGGGGQPFYATAGGNNADGLKAALEKAKSLV